MLSARDIINEFSKALAAGRGSIFVGSGISSPSGLPSWADLLKDMARSRLNLDLLPDDDLPLVAQHIVNRTGSRGPLIAHFRETLNQKYHPNSYHTILSRCNVKRLWTTNYDTLLEDTFKRHTQVTVRASDESISRAAAVSDIEVIKMHGCIQQSEGEDLVVTQEDYENFFEFRPATCNRLKQDLIDRQFLFIGYSYADSNIKNIVVEARRLAKNSPIQHYIVLPRQKEGSQDEIAAKQARQDLWLADLSRLGIAACQIDDFSELEQILQEIALRSRGETVFVTGSHKRESLREDNHPKELGKLLAEQRNIILLDGQSSGIGRIVMSAYMDECLISNIDVLDRLRLFSNPYAANPRLSDNPKLLSTLMEWRAPLMRSAQVVVVYNGGMGTETEVQLARELGCKIIPVPEHAGDLPSHLLSINEIGHVIKMADPDYFEKALKNSVTPQDVVDCIKRMFNK
ncbi:SIR2 family protein [Azotobacter beijerinckii]|uniref:SIR2 family protein n=1 Tax=Azotobacter beijerinckii TaxID=170623 RepID=UPI002952F023|nr:SIR2 family protein [Azotobacter beijerinckii]MDV7212495.1 SIR2 family protein [Azotobacter beijerinckii]